MVISDRDELLAELTGSGAGAVPATVQGARLMASRAMRVPAPAGIPPEELVPIVMEITPEPVEMSETMTVVFELIDGD